MLNIKRITLLSLTGAVGVLAYSVGVNAQENDAIPLEDVAQIRLWHDPADSAEQAGIEPAIEWHFGERYGLPPDDIEVSVTDERRDDGLAVATAAMPEQRCLVFLKPDPGVNAYGWTIVQTTCSKS